MKGWKTVAFGALMIIVPQLLNYFAAVDWRAVGVSPSVSAAIGAVIIGLRAITSTAVGQAK
jgi:hypothetical protein